MSFSRSRRLTCESCGAPVLVLRAGMDGSVVYCAQCSGTGMVDVEMDEVMVTSCCPLCGAAEDGCYCRYEAEERDE